MTSILPIPNKLDKKTKAAYATFNQTVTFVTACPGMWSHEVCNAWRGVKHPQFIWGYTNTALVRWTQAGDNGARDFLRLMAQFWQCGVRDTTDTLESEARDFLARLAFLMRVHEEMARELKWVRPALLGWKIHCYLKDEALDAPLPAGRTSWQAYIVGAITAVRRCREGGPLTSPEIIREYLKNGLLPEEIGFTAEELETWSTEAQLAQLKARLAA